MKPRVWLSALALCAGVSTISMAEVTGTVKLPLAPGGMLGVGVFFTLSGYLITDLLLGHWRDRGNLGLREFWLRRARRLRATVRRFFRPAFVTERVRAPFFFPITRPATFRRAPFFSAAAATRRS